MSERIGWMPGNKSTFSVAHKYTEIKSQKISPEGKSKIQLQIVLHDGNSTNFHFVNPAGQPAQLEELSSSIQILDQTQTPRTKILELNHKTCKGEI